jgi:peroxiredoxin-like protein
MTSLNHTYATNLEWTGERRGQMTSPGLPELEVAAPPEFKGHEGIWTPEHLFVGAISSCFMTTFLAIAELSKLEVVAFATSAEGRLEKVEGIGLQITEVLLRPRLTLRRPEDRDRALRILEKAERNCLISNSATSRVRLEPEILVEDGVDVAHSHPVTA